MQNTLQAVANSIDSGLHFPFNLPKDGLALRSVGIVNGIPELRFEALPNVPTVSEGDVAVGFKLVMKGECPEFTFPPTHPFWLHLSPFYKHCSPDWLRGTGIGELLAETDWRMKCLTAGIITNNKKTVFKSRSKECNLDTLATFHI